MPRKTYSEDICIVTFDLPAGVNAQTAHLVGEFNDWDRETHAMHRTSGGSFVLTIGLPAGRTYRFRYLLDDERWENDWQADAYEPNSYGSYDSIIHT
jgi:1,4-alpha-glucan branching enzyme